MVLIHFTVYWIKHTLFISSGSAIVCIISGFFYHTQPMVTNNTTKSNDYINKSIMQLNCGMPSNFNNH